MEEDIWTQQPTLEHVRDKLQQHIFHFQNEIKNQLDLEYNTLLNIPIEIETQAHNIDNLKSKIEEITKGVQNFEDKINKHANEFLPIWETKQSIKEKKNWINSVLKIYKKLDQIESWCLKWQHEKDKVDSNSNDNMKWMERVSLEYSQLILLMDSNLDLPIIQKLDSRIAQLNETILKLMQMNYESCLDKVIVYQNNEQDVLELAQCFKAYASISNSEKAYSLFESKVITPAFKQIFKIQSNQQMELKQYYDQVINFLKLRCQPIFNIIYQRFKFLKLDLLTNVVFPNLCEHLNTLNQTNSIFATNIDIFLKNFKLTLTFLNEFEELFMDLDGVIAFRQSKQYIKFKSLWKVEDYFIKKKKTVFKNIQLNSINDLTKWDLIDEKELGLEILSLPKFNHNLKFKFLFTAQLAHHLSKLWSSEEYLLPFSKEAFKLSLLLIQTYSIVILNIIPDLKKCDLNFIIMFYLDINLFSNLIKDHLLPIINELFQQNDQVELNLDFGLKEIDSIIINKLIQTTLVNLEKVKQIPTFYRHTNKPEPSKFSEYLTDPFHQLIQIQNNEKLKTFQASWIEPTTYQVCENYHQLVNEIIQNLLRTKESLLRLKKGNLDKQLEQDELKINKQIVLDVQRFGVKLMQLTSRPKIKSSLFNLYSTVDELAKVYNISLE